MQAYFVTTGQGTPINFSLFRVHVGLVSSSPLYHVKHNCAQDHFGELTTILKCLQNASWSEAAESDAPSLAGKNKGDFSFCSAASLQQDHYSGSSHRTTATRKYPLLKSTLKPPANSTPLTTNHAQEHVFTIQAVLDPANKIIFQNLKTFQGCCKCHVARHYHCDTLRAHAAKS